MKTILFSLPGNEELTELMATKMDAEVELEDNAHRSIYCL